MRGGEVRRRVLYGFNSTTEYMYYVPVAYNKYKDTYKYKIYKGWNYGLPGYDESPLYIFIWSEFSWVEMLISAID